MSNPISNLSKLELLKPQDLNCNIFSVYDYDSFSIQELLSTFFDKINECVNVSNATFTLAEWLVSVGLKQEVAITLDRWLLDGTLEDVINEKIFNDLNTKIKKVERNIEANVYDFGAVGDGEIDDTKAIQDCIDYVSSNGGGVVKINQGVYKTTKPIILSDYIRLVGSGSTCEIRKVKSGLTTLADDLDFMGMTREDMLQYDACIVTAGKENNYISVENIHLTSYDTSQKVQWGMLTPFMGISFFINVTCYDFIEGMRHFMSWNLSFEGLRFRRCEYGVRLEMNGNKTGGSTSWNMSRIGVDSCTYGFKFCDLHYTGMNNLTVDNGNGRAYWFVECSGVSINGLGYEESKGQIIKLTNSQVSITGFEFLWPKPVDFRPLDMTKDVLIEVSVNKLGYGLTLSTGEILDDNSGLHKLYISPSATVIAENITNNMGNDFEELEPSSSGKFNYIGDYYTLITNPLRAEKYVKVGRIRNHYYDRTYNHYMGATIYNDVLNESSIEEVRLSVKELANNFDFMKVLDPLTWIPLKITVQCGSEGTGNNIWLAPTSIKTIDKYVMDTDIVKAIHTDGVNLVIEFNKPVSRPKVIISIF